MIRPTRMTDDPLASILPPHSLEAEQALLGAMLLDPAAVPVAGEFLDASAFYRTSHQRLFTLLSELYAVHGSVDPVLVRDELSRRGLTEAVGGEAVLADLMGSIGSPSQAEHYARIVKEKSVLRGLIQAGRRIVQEAQGAEPAEAVLEKAQQLVFELACHQESRRVEHIGDALKEVFRRLESPHDSASALSTGFTDLDDFTAGGLHRSEFIIVAARPSVGKTSFALGLAHNVALLEERPKVGIFSMEQTKEQVAEILACSHAGVNRDKVRKRMYSHEDWDRLVAASGKLNDAKIYIDDTPGLTLHALRTKAREMKARFKGLDLLVIDYLQLMESPQRKTEGRQQEISDISRGLKSLAREMEVPLVALSQLNRQVMSREGGRPRLSDLRESGALEQDADVVIFLSRKDYESQETIHDQGEIRLDIAKQRNGPVGDFKLAFLKDCQRFGNYSRQESSEAVVAP